MSEWARTLLVGAGGFVGVSLRHHLGGLVHRVVSPEFPWGTFLINVSGCFVIGFLAILVEIVDAEDKIQSFLPVLDGMVQEGLVTIEKATVIFYRAGEPPAEP